MTKADGQGQDYVTNTKNMGISGYNVLNPTISTLLKNQPIWQM